MPHQASASAGPRVAQRGAALLLAMLVVTLVATLASAALWQQWRATEVETAERQRLQAGWILTGALDWARLILREDARGNLNSNNADHLGEPWAMPLEEARLSSFLAADRNNNADDVRDAFLSGDVTDMQSRLNFMNLVKLSRSGTEAKIEISAPDMQAFTRLFEQLQLPVAELKAAAEELRSTTEQAANQPMPSRTALKPQQFAQLSWLGISPASLAVLEPYVVVLPDRTPVNINTASAAVLMASIPQLNNAQAQSLVTERERNPFKNLADATRFQPSLTGQLSDEQHSTRSRYFEIRGRLRLDDVVIQERSLVVREGLDVRVRWRERRASP